MDIVNTSFIDSFNDPKYKVVNFLLFKLYFKYVVVISIVWSAGNSVARVKDVPSCEELVSRLVSNAEAIMDGRLKEVRAS